MKNTNLIGTVLLSIALAGGSIGCKHQTMVTPIPGGGGPPQPTVTTPPPAPIPTPAPAPAPPITSSGPGPGDATSTLPPTTGQPIPLDYKEFGPLFDGPHTEDREKFKADTIYFDFDSSTVKAGEESKLQEVANYFKDNPKLEGLIIEGNCDERGTEKYNLSLGERRALAAREYLANLGVKPERLKTVTYGASRPADPGHAEEAWKKNRRDEFILVTAK